MISGGDTHGDPASMPLGSVVAGRYQTTRLLGEGGFGAVFEAIDRSSGGRVALKIISGGVLDMAGGQERFRREVDIVRRLSHPNIVRVLDAGLDDRGTLYIAFELLQGHSLEQELEKRGALQPRRVAVLAKQVLAALDAAHAAGIVHRDIKPPNVYLVGESSDTVKLLDFGIAKSTNANSMQGLTKHGMMLGTPAYMSPEQLFGKPVGPSSDLFAFGIVMAEMLNGRTLYKDDVNPMSIIQERIQAGRVPIPDSVRQSPLGELIDRAVDMDGAVRFQTAREMLQALEQLEPRLVNQSFTTGGTLPSAVAALPISGNAGTTEIGTPRPQGYRPVDPGPQPQPGYTAPGSFSPPPYGPPAYATAPAGWAPPPPAWAPAPIKVAKRSRGSGPLIMIVIVLVSLAGAGVAIYLGMSSTEEPREKRSKKERTKGDDTEGTSTAKDAPQPPRTQKTADPIRTPPPTVTPPPPPPTASAVVEPATLRVCKGVAALTQPTLRQRLTGAGLTVTGDLRYCAGNMINFRCDGPDGRGFTTAGGGGNGKGSAALFKLPSPADADAFAKKEATGPGPLTIAYDGGKVLRLEMPSATAASVLANICK